VAFEVPAEGAVVASGDGAAVGLTDGHEKRMVFVIELYIPREMFHKKRLDLVVGGVTRNEPVARENPPGVRVDDENRHLRRVQEDRIRRFRADPRNLEESLSNPRRFPPQHAPEASPVACPEHGQKVVKPPGLDKKSARRADQFRQVPPGQGRHCRRAQPPFPAKASHGLFDILPAGVLGENCPDDHLESGSSGPPALGTQLNVEPSIYVE